MTDHGRSEQPEEHRRIRLPTDRRVVLASGSPRRRELLQRLIPAFEVLSPDIDETDDGTRHPIEHAVHLATKKARTVAAMRPDGFFDTAIAADTVVFIGSRLLEKPKDPEEARRFLETLSGRSHTVCTAMTVAIGPSTGSTDSLSLLETATLTRVCFRPLEAHEIEWYLSTEEWKGVAGGYRLQEAGAALIASIRGSYTNVVGLPLETLFSILWA